MVVMTNPVLGIFYSLSSFKLNKDGLYKKVYGPNKETYLLFLTNDVRKILEVFDIDFDVFDNSDNIDEINKIICSSPYTDIPKYLNIKINDKCIKLSNFTEWLNNNPEYIIAGKLRTQRVSDVLGINIAERVNTTQDIIDKYLPNKRTKMVGIRFLESLSDYDKNNFNDDFKSFIKSKSELDHMSMVVNNSFEEILEEFKTFISYKESSSNVIG